MFQSAKTIIRPPLQFGCLMTVFTDRNMYLYLNKVGWLCLTDTQQVTLNVLQTQGCPPLNHTLIAIFYL